MTRSHFRAIGVAKAGIHLESGSFEGVAKTINTLKNTKATKEKLFFVLFVVQVFSAFCNRFHHRQGFGLDQESQSII